MPTLDVDGISLYYTVNGKGIPIVFIHPPVLTCLNFKYQVEELSKEFQVITFDIRGHGRSQYSNQQVTYPLIVEDIKRLLDHLKIKKAFIIFLLLHFFFIFIIFINIQSLQISFDF